MNITVLDRDNAGQSKAVPVPARVGVVIQPDFSQIKALLSAVESGGKGLTPTEITIESSVGAPDNDQTVTMGFKAAGGGLTGSLSFVCGAKGTVVNRPTDAMTLVPREPLREILCASVRISMQLPGERSLFRAEF